MKILMVCLGNICRSPMAEGVMSHLVRDAQLDWEIDSAGTGAWHVGEQPDRRAIATCKRHGIDISDQRARRIHKQDLDDFDLILTMDRDNYDAVKRLAVSKSQADKVKMILSFGTSDRIGVPDPYYDGSFDNVYTLLQSACADVIHALQQSN